VPCLLCLSVSHSVQIVYLSDTHVGPLAVLDASECPPTFGADFNDIRAFIDHGWACLDNREGDQSHRGANYRLALSDFVSDVVPCLGSADLVVVVSCLSAAHPTPPTDLTTALSAVLATEASTAAITVLSPTYDAKPPHLDVATTLTVSLRDVQPFSFLPTIEELAAKLVLNAFSTAVHVLRGTVFRNRMVNVSVSNHKLFHRAVGILVAVTGREHADAQTALLRSIYEVDEVSPELASAPIAQHVEKAKAVQRVVPVAILLLLSASPVSVATAREQVNRHRQVRLLIQDLQHTK